MRLIDPPPGREESRDALLLVATQPGLARLAQDAAAEIIDKVADDDEHKRDRVHPVDVQVQRLDPDDHAPEVARQQGDVHERGRRQAEDEGRGRVEEGQAEGVADEVPGNLAVPVGGLEGGAVEDGGLDAVDHHAPEGELADDLVDGALADEVLLDDVGEAVESGGEQGEQVALDLAAAGIVAAVGAGDVVGGDEDAHAADADEDAEDLGVVVADVQQEEGDDDDDDDGPEVDQLGGEHGCVAIGEDDEVVTFDVAECEDEVCCRQQHILKI